MGKGLQLKTTTLLVFFLWLVKKLVNNIIVDHLKKCVFFLISSMVLGLLDQLEILTAELLWLLTGLGLLKLQHLIYPRFFTRFGMLVFFTNLGLMEFQVWYLALFLLFSVTDGFEWMLMGSLYKNIQLMLEFLKAVFLVLHFSYYTLMTFVMLSVILLSMLMILLSILSVIRHLVCCSNFNWLLNLNLICETLWTRTRSGLLISMLGKLNWHCLVSLITLVLLM